MPRTTGLKRVGVQREIEKIPERLALLRGNDSQRAFAKRLGVNQQTLHRYEKYGTVPHASYLILLALKDGVSLDWLLTGRGKMRASA